MGKNRTNRNILIYLALLLALAATVFIGTEIFQIDKITVTGSETVDKDVIISLSGITYGQNIFKISRSLVTSRIEENPPYLIVASIGFKLPDEVVIAVEERKPTAYIPYLSSFIVIDVRGFILDIIKQFPDPDLPQIQGIGIKNFTKGTHLAAADRDEYKERILFRLLEAVDKSDTIGSVSVLNVEDPDNIRVITREGYDVFLGQALELEKKLSWLKSEDGYGKIVEAGVPGILDISVADKMVFRPEAQSNEDDEEGSGN
jgi:cell division protein FtsQ